MGPAGAAHDNGKGLDARAHGEMADRQHYAALCCEKEGIWDVRGATSGQPNIVLTTKTKKDAT